MIEDFQIAPLVHVLIPVYNHSKFLKRSIESVLNQTYQNLEIFVLDDGSTEKDVSAILNDYSSHPKIKVFSQGNKGLPNSLNRLYDESLNSDHKPHYQTWHSSDNVYDPKAISELVSFMLKNPDLGFTYANVRLINEDDSLAKNSEYRRNDHCRDDSSVLNLEYPVSSLTQFNDNFINACFLTLSRIEKVLPKFNPSDLGFEDYKRWLQFSLVKSGCHIGSPDPLYLYRLHPSSLTSSFKHNELAERQYSTFVRANNLFDLLNENKVSLKSVKPFDFLRLGLDTHSEAVLRNRLVKSPKQSIALKLNVTKGFSVGLEKAFSSVTLTSRMNLFHSSHIHNYRFIPSRLTIQRNSLEYDIDLQGAYEADKILSRAKNRNLGMFNRENQEIPKFMLFTPSEYDENIIKNILQLLDLEEEFILALYCFTDAEKEVADKIYLGSHCSMKLRIVFEADCRVDFQSKSTGLLNLIGSVDAIISLTCFEDKLDALKKYAHDVIAEIRVAEASGRHILVSRDIFYTTSEFIVPNENCLDWNVCYKLPKIKTEKIFSNEDNCRTKIADTSSAYRELFSAVMVGLI